MFNETTDLISTNGSTPPSFSDIPTTEAGSLIDTSPSGVVPSNVYLDVIAANDISSRANYVYSFLAALGFVAACFLLYSFILTYRAQRRLAWLDSLLWVFCGFQLLLLLLSLYAVGHRPDYLKTTGLGCAALSFTINAVTLCSLLVLLLMAYVLTLDPPSDVLLKKPGVCAALVTVTSVLISLVLAGVRGPRDGVHKEVDCFMDPVSAGSSYAVSKFCLVFLMPYILQLGLLMGGCVRQWKTKGRFLSGSEDGPMFLTVSVVMFFCLLFYSTALVRAARIEEDGLLSPREKAFLNIAEFVSFSGSSISLLLVLFMHRPSRETLCGVFMQLRDCCQRPG